MGLLAVINAPNETHQTLRRAYVSSDILDVVSPGNPHATITAAYAAREFLKETLSRWGTLVENCNGRSYLNAPDEFDYFIGVIQKHPKQDDLVMSIMYCEGQFYSNKHSTWWNFFVSQKTLEVELLVRSSLQMIPPRDFSLNLVRAAKACERDHRRQYVRHPSEEQESHYWINVSKVPDDAMIKKHFGEGQWLTIHENSLNH